MFQLMAQQKFVNDQSYFQLSIHVQIHMELVDIVVTILGLKSYKSTMTQATANSIRPKAKA